MEYTGKTADGKTVTIWNEFRHGVEFWMWSASYSDGSGYKFGGGVSLAACKINAPFIVGRYKKVTTTPTP